MGPDCNTTVTALTVTVFAAAKNRSRNTNPSETGQLKRTAESRAGGGAGVRGRC
jgi:hypothetical protein